MGKKIQGRRKKLYLLTKVQTQIIAHTPTCRHQSILSLLSFILSLIIFMGSCFSKRKYEDGWINIGPIDLKLLLCCSQPILPNENLHFQ